MILPAALADSWLPQAVGWALIHSLWQGLLLSLALLSTLTVSRSARIRYVAGLTAMALLLVAFVTTLALSVPQAMSDSPGPGAAASDVSVFLGASAPTSPDVAPGRLHLIAPYLSVFWVAGVFACHVWQLAGLLSVRRLRRRGVSSVTEQWERELRRLGKELGVTRPVALFESLMVNTPIVIGHLRPLILVPVGLLARVPVGQVEAILLHELAHIRRCDYMVNLIQRWVETLFFYNPAMWWMSSVIRCEREACCDDMAAAVCGDPHRYAGALAALEESRFHSQDLPALAAAAGSLRTRVNRLLRQNPPSGTRGIVSFVTIVAASSALAVAGWQANATSSLTAPPSAVKEAPTLEPSGTAGPSPPLVAQANPAAERLLAPQQALSAEDASPFRKWVNQDVAYLIDEVERAAFDRLTTDEERQMFIEQFWQRREASAPPPGGRSAKEEHYRRIAYANQRFAAGGTPGWKTDRGRIYIVWGPPPEIESHPTAQGGRPAYEVWRYRAGPGGQSGRFFTFADVDITGDYRLQTDAQPSVFNRMLRWTVVDPLNRFVTGLTQEHFMLREHGELKPLTYFEPPGTPTAVAVVSGADLPDLAALPLDQPVIQTRTLADAVARLRNTAAVRKALIIVRGTNLTAAGPIPGGIHAMVADASAVRSMIVEIVNQYVAEYRSDSPGDPELVVNAVPGLPVLRIGWLR